MTLSAAELVQHMARRSTAQAAAEAEPKQRTEILPLVEADLRARIAKGRAEYGESLTSHNGRDALWDAYEEALDLALYLRQAIVERG